MSTFQCSSFSAIFQICVLCVCHKMSQIKNNYTLFNKGTIMCTYVIRTYHADLLEIILPKVYKPHHYTRCLLLIDIR